MGRHGARAVRLGATLVVAGVCASACGQAQFAAAPDPEFTRGRPPETTVAAAATTPVTAEEPELGAVEPDAPSIDVDQMLVVDDAGNAVANQSGWATFDERIGSVLAGNYGAAVAVMIDGAVVHRAAFGERVAGTGEPVEVTDRFRIGSISKTITAITTLRLVEQGALTLDDPIGGLLIEHLGLTRFDPDVPGITVRELLSHTAGLPKHDALMFGNGATSCVDAAAIGLSSSVGSGGYTYSNMGYCVLTVLIEAVTGMAYERVVHDQLLDPLGLDGMRVTSTYELGPDEVSHHPVPGRNYMETLGGAGSWNATPADLVTIVNAVDPLTPGWKALSDEMMTAMRYRIPTGAAPQGYGLGIINYGGEAWGHTGTIENTHAMVLVQPDGVTWAVTVAGNSPSESEALRGIVRSAFAAAFPG